MLMIRPPPASAASRFARRRFAATHALSHWFARSARSWLLPDFGLALDEGLEALGNLRLGHPFEAGVGDRGDRGIDAPDDVGTAGGGVLVGRFVQALDGELDGVGPRQVVA